MTNPSTPPAPDFDTPLAPDEVWECRTEAGHRECSFYNEMAQSLAARKHWTVCRVRIVPAAQVPRVEPLVFTRNVRGFAYAEFADLYGHRASLQKSSLATDDSIWLGINEPDPKILPGDGTGWHPYPLPENVQCNTRMHLSREQVAALLPALILFVETGELPAAAAPESGRQS